jgi:hypothetical protein
LLHAAIFPGSEFLFSQDSISKLLANDGQQVKVGQTAQLPMLRAFWKIELKETGCRLLLSRI